MVVDLPSAEDDLLSRATPVIAALAFGALLGAAVEDDASSVYRVLAELAGLS